MIYPHGAPKVFEGKMMGIAADLEALGWPLPTIQAFFATYIEFAGGILLVVGLFTRPVALAAMMLFAIISFVYLGDDPFVAKEKAFIFFLMSTYVFFNGPGRMSVDNFLFKRTVEPEPVVSDELPPSEPEQPAEQGQ
jgi:putative oxidoreductase